MGITRRIRRIIKGYVKTARERLDELEAELNARRELEEYLEPAGSTGAKPMPETATPPTGSAPTASQTRAAQTPMERQTAAGNSQQMSADLLAHFRLLGIPPNADMRKAQEAYEQLMERANPERFPEGSEERRRAEQIRQRIQQAYDAIKQHLDPTSARFDRLEI
ncbi:MAG: J domain-containing protein [Armatimonadota bacterium]|nr:J domain-containing protein [bacterium]MDW8322116.1 J domain-containing protein [Armatimonadota bacterium]